MVLLLLSGHETDSPKILFHKMFHSIILRYFITMENLLIDL